MYNGYNGKKRKVDSLQIKTKPELLLIINSMPKLRDRALASFIYLTGCRISEILGTEKKSRKYAKEDIKNNVSYEERIPEKEETFKVEPLRKESIEINLGDDIIRVHNVMCLKRRFENHLRTIPIIISQESEFVNIFLEYYNTLLPGSQLFNINRQRAWQIMNKYGIFNHFLIHERCTHLAAYKNFGPLDLQKFRGWRDTTPATVYAHLNTEDIANKMRGKNQS